MANAIKMCCVILFLTVWLTEAYSGKRFKRHAEHNEEKSYFQLKATSVHENTRNSSSILGDHINTNDYEDDHSNNEIDIEKIQENKNVNIDFVETSVTSSVDSNKVSYTSNDDTWVDLVINGAILAQPYIPVEFKNLHLNWQQVEVALRSLEQGFKSYRVGARSLNMSPIMSTVRAVAAAAEPMIMDYVRMGLGMVLDLIDNTAFMTTGHAISRRGLSESVIDDIMDAFTAIMEHMADDEESYDS